MAYELVAARLLAPSVGSSTYVWTGVIGVIIIALSAGCWLGGRVADYRHAPQDVGLLLIIAAALVVATMLNANDVLRWLTTTLDEPRIQAVIAALVLFAPASFVLGAASPYLAKLNVSSLNTAGRSVANLSALDAVGGRYRRNVCYWICAARRDWTKRDVSTGSRHLVSNELVVYAAVAVATAGVDGWSGNYHSIERIVRAEARRRVGRDSKRTLFHR